MILFKKILKWALIALAVIYVVAVIIRTFHFHNLDKTNAEVEKIHDTKLQLNDVIGKNLPPDPGIDADKTVAGVDANNNGIRDDVEIAIFKQYPDSEKTRAVLLQYALALQMEAIQPIVNTDIVVAVVQEEGRADSCVADTLVPRENPESSRSNADMDKIDSFISFVKKLQINTTERYNARQDFYSKIGSYDSLPDSCDIDYSTLPN